MQKQTLNVTLSFCNYLSCSISFFKHQLFHLLLFFHLFLVDHSFFQSVQEHATKQSLSPEKQKSFNFKPEQCLEIYLMQIHDGRWTIFALILLVDELVRLEASVQRCWWLVLPSHYYRLCPGCLESSCRRGRSKLVRFAQQGTLWVNQNWWCRCPYLSKEHHRQRGISLYHTRLAVMVKFTCMYSGLMTSNSMGPGASNFGERHDK